MRLKKITGFIIVLLNIAISINLMAQATGQILDLPKVLPPSPNAASLGKFGDIPVGAYTGIPNTAIPLYTMKVGKFTLPISIDYHSGGLKVEEISGSMGLGWAFSAGGVITRSMHGLPDESAMGYWQHTGWTNAYIASSETITAPFCGGTYDKQPDIFYFNFAGQSGKFILDSTAQHNARFMPFNNLKLTHDAGLNSFQITDANGIIYNFSSKETTTNDNAGSLVTTFVSAWYLTSIITPAGNINFTYSSEQMSQLQLSEADYLNTGPNLCYQFNPGYTTSTDEIDVNSLILSQISSPYETINIQTTGNRQDMKTASMISGMTVSDMNGRLVKKIAFTHSYFGNTSSTNPNDVRLKLDRVDDISITDTTQKKTYKLQYYSPALVPSIASFAKDYWGFYNGQTSNITCLPYIDPTIYGAYVANQANKYGIRTPDYTKSQVGVLQSIQYPTGGSSQFIYEGNDYSSSDGVAPHQTTNVTQQAIVNAKITSSVNIPSNTVNFSISTAQTGTLTFTGSFMGGPTPAGNGPSIILNKINADGSRTNILQLSELNSTYTRNPVLAVGNYELIGSVDGNNLSISGTLSYYYIDTLASHLVHIFPTGGVRIKQIINSDPVTGNTNTKTYTYRSTTDTTLSSGVLVSDFLILDTKNSYTYGCGYLVRAATSANYLGSTQGSHVGYGVVTEKETGSVNNGKKESYFYTSNDFSNLFTTQNGITAANDLGPSGQNKRYQTDYDVYRGFLKKELIYNMSGEVIHSTVNNYNYNQAILPGSPNYYAAQATAGYTNHVCVSVCTNCMPGTSSGDNGCSGYSLDNYTIVNYQILCPWIYKTSTINTTYDQNGQNPLVDSISYFYDNPSHGEVTRTIVNNSRGEVLKTVNIYAADQSQITGLDAVSSAALDSMVNRNMIAPVIQQEQYNNSNLVTRERTDYQIWPGPNRNISPTRLWYQVSTNPIEDRINFIAYNTSDNLKQVSKDGGINISYLWDYKSAYPIAEIKNASQTDIAYTSFEADSSGNWVVPSASRDTITTALTGYKSYNLSSGNITKSSLNSATTYVVSYWTRNSTSFNIAGTIGGYPVKGPTINNWTYYEHRITGQSGITISGNGNIDELKLYPLGALMSTYTYLPSTGVSTMTDTKGQIFYYQYDGLQRLINVRDQYGNIVKHTDYHFQGQ